MCGEVRADQRQHRRVAEDYEGRCRGIDYWHGGDSGQAAVFPDVMQAPWLDIARRDLGLAEVPGAETAPKIKQWLADLGAWWRDDETPWCGVAVGAWMKQ